MSNYSVLLVEDNPVNQEVGRTMIEAFGCVVDVASNGYEVLDRMEPGGYDIIFMDCEMPMMDGLEATRLIRKHEKQHGKPRTAIVAMTARATDEDRSRCLDAGMDDYLGKPFRMLDLSHMMGKWCLRASARNSALRSQGFHLDGKSSENITGNYLDQKSLNNIRSLGPNGPRMLSAIIGIYLNDSPILLDRLSETFYAADLDGLARAAHALKSSSLGLGAIALAEMCRQAENIARANSMGGADMLIFRIRSEYVKVEEALQQEIKKGF